MSENQNRVLRLVMVGILLFSMFVVAREGSEYVYTVKGIDIVGNMGKGSKDDGGRDTAKAKERLLNKKMQAEGNEKAAEFCVVIDAGHGGKDPGKVGVNGAMEKDINLQIALLLKMYLEADDVKVVMTREDERGLYDESASNKKVQDMKKRLEIIEKAEPDLVISIHQNSYHEEYVKGAQVFYYTTSEKSKSLAEVIQAQLKSLDEENSRQAKGNDSYYLLKKTARPIVIVECGFLSNREEAESLITPVYQEKIAFQIHMGIMKYLNALH